MSKNYCVTNEVKTETGTLYFLGRGDCNPDSEHVCGDTAVAKGNGDGTATVVAVKRCADTEEHQIESPFVSMGETVSVVEPESESGGFLSSLCFWR